MASVFLDANVLFDILEQRKTVNLLELSKYNLKYSPLSIHIYLYVYKLKIPQPVLALFLEKLQLKAVSLSPEIVKKSLDGPTNDFEDNVQLHSAKESGCDYFLTDEEKLWSRKFFNGVKIVKELAK